MNYTAIHFKLKNPSSEIREIIIAELDQLGYEGFLETEKGVVGYISNEVFNEETIKQLEIFSHASPGEIEIEKEFILEKNWNELWEQNYDPVVIEDKVLIYAPFHQIEKNYPFEILIEPKMSFGTGHHDTTALMIESMLDIDFTNKNVLDMGCGTGILSILASKMGASSITAVDLNEWAYDNTIENISKNNISNIKTILGNVELIRENKFDIILANINKNVLIDQIKDYTTCLNQGALLFLCGILISDLDEILQTGMNQGLSFEGHKKKKNWIVMKFVK